MKKRFNTLIVLTLLALLPALAHSGPVLPEGFVDLKTFIPSIQMEIRYYSDDNFVGERTDGYHAPKAILSKEAALALQKIVRELEPFGLGLKVYDAYRPQRAVDHFVRWAKVIDDTRMKAKYYPEVDKKDLFKDGYIAAKSGHSHGSTVDLTIVSLDSANPEMLDMGSSWDYFGPRSWPSSQAVTPTQRAHRMLLQMVMVKHGFEPLKEEWWHFTFKDEPYKERYFDFLIE